MNATSLIVNYIHQVNSQTGFVGLIEYKFPGDVDVSVNVSQNIFDCYISVQEKSFDLAIKNDLAIDHLDQVDRYMTLGLLAGIKLDAQKAAKALSYPETVMIF